MLRKFTCIALLVCFALRVHAQDDSYAAHVQQYIKQYKSLAIAEQKRSGIPAAVTLGQGILETQAGTSVLVTGANNHFGIKCKKEWTGETFAHTDDAPNECFRKYPKAIDSYRDHSDYLKSSARYSALFKLSKTDYAGWAVGLKRCGYATNPRYAQQLIKIIEDFKLQDYTYAALDNDGDYTPDGTAISKPGTRSATPVLDDNDPVLVRANLQKATSPAAAAAIAAKPSTPVAVVPPVAKQNNTYVKEYTPPKQEQKDLKAAEPPATNEPLAANNMQAGGAPLNNANPVTVNGLKAVYAFKGEMPLQYAIKFNIRYEHLLEMNDLPDAPLAANMFVYLEKKGARGLRPYHTVRAGETLAQVSQTEGVQLRRIMAMNHIDAGEEPVPGTQLYLQDNSPAKPQVITAAKTGAQQDGRFLDNDIRKSAATPNYIDKNTISQGNPAFNNDAVAAQPVNNTRRSTVISAPATQTLAPVQAKPKPVEPVPANTMAAAKPSETKQIAEAKPAPKPATATATPAITKPLLYPIGTNTAARNPPAATRPTQTLAVSNTNPPAPKPVVKEEPKIETPVATTPKKNETSAAAEEDNRKIEEDNTKIAETETAPKAIARPVEVKLAEVKPVVVDKPAEPAPIAVEKPAEVKPVAIEKPAETKPAVIEKPAEVKPLAIEKPVETKPAVIEKPAGPAQPEEPMDDLAKLKARLDKVVYVNDKKVAAVNRNTATDNGTPVASNTSGDKYYTVRDGDTAFSIAKDNNISMKQLNDWNNLDFGEIKTGQKLRVKE